MTFEWDAENRKHIARHGITPEEAEEAVLIEPLEAAVQHHESEERVLDERLARQTRLTLVGLLGDPVGLLETPEIRLRVVGLDLLEQRGQARGLLGLAAAQARAREASAAPPWWLRGRRCLDAYLFLAVHGVDASVRAGSRATVERRRPRAPARLSSGSG